MRLDTGQRPPSVDRVQKLCQVLELEFYIGPSRGRFEVDEAQLALEATERGFAAGGQRLALAECED